MSVNSYTTTFTVDRTPAEVFAAITNVRAWWSADIEGSTTTLDDEFVFHVENVHRSRLRLTELVPDHRVVWRVLENSLSFVEDQTEWVGTELVFEISQGGAGTQVRFTHDGLVPQYEGFDVCSNAWAFYVNGSLQRLITTGLGLPHRNEEQRVVTTASE